MQYVMVCQKSKLYLYLWNPFWKHHGFTHTHFKRYVWVPHVTIQVADVEHAPVEDEINVSDFLDDVAEEHDNGMTRTDK